MPAFCALARGCAERLGPFPLRHFLKHLPQQCLHQVSRSSLTRDGSRGKFLLRFFVEGLSSFGFPVDVLPLDLIPWTTRPPSQCRAAHAFAHKFVHYWKSEPGHGRPPVLNEITPVGQTSGASHREPEAARMKEGRRAGSKPRGAQRSVRRSRTQCGAGSRSRICGRNAPRPRTHPGTSALRSQKGGLSPRVGRAHSTPTHGRARVETAPHFRSSLRVAPGVAVKIGYLIGTGTVVATFRRGSRSHAARQIGSTTWRRAQALRGRSSRWEAKRHRVPGGGRATAVTPRRVGHALARSCPRYRPQFASASLRPACRCALPPRVEAPRDRYAE